MKMLIYQTEVVEMSLQKLLTFQGFYLLCPMYPFCFSHMGALGG